MDRSKVFAALRGPVFAGRIPQTAVTTIDLILDEAERRGLPLGHLAYILATARWEPGEPMIPVTENLYYTKASRIRETWRTRFPTNASAEPFVKNPRALANKVYNGRMGNRLGSDDGWIHRGHGLAQLTGREGFEKAGIKLGLPLLEKPELALEPPVAVRILIEGMEEGWFTGYSLSDAAEVPGYIDDRKIINGTDKAAVIAALAVSFEAALMAGGYVGGAVPLPIASVPAVPDAPAEGLTSEEAAAVAELAGWLGRKPAGAEATIAWFAQMPKGIAA